MALFKRNWDKPGPGVPKNAPKKTGIPRFFELIGREFTNLIKLNFILTAILLPAVILYTLSLVYYFVASFPVAFLLAGAALLACIPAGPALTAFYYILVKMLRDAPGFLWHDFKRIFKENFRPMVVPGILFGAMVGSMGFAFLYRSLPGVEIGSAITTIYFIAGLFLAMVYPYFFTHAAYIDLPPLKTLQNSFLLAFANLPRSFVGTLLGTGLILLQIVLFPYATIVTPIFGLSIPALMNLMWIWPRIDQTFKIDEALKKRHEEQYSDVAGLKED